VALLEKYRPSLVEQYGTHTVQDAVCDFPGLGETLLLHRNQASWFFKPPYTTIPALAGSSGFDFSPNTIRSKADLFPYRVSSPTFTQ
jgi:hypothetical protein